MAEESIATELGKRVNEIIRLIEQRYFCDEDLIQVRLDWLYNAIVRYIDQIPSGETVLGVVREAAELLNTSTSDDHGGDLLDTNISFHAELVPTGRRVRPRFLISIEQLEFLLDMRFTSGEIALMFGVSESTVKRRIREYDSFVRKRYSDISEENLDSIVGQLMIQFPNCGYKRMTGLLLDAGHRIQQQRIRDCMRRVNPEGVFLRALELQAVRQRKYQVSGPLALWHVDGNHKLIR